MGKKKKTSESDNSPSPKKKKGGSAEEPNFPPSITNKTPSVRLSNSLHQNSNPLVNPDPSPSRASTSSRLNDQATIMVTSKKKKKKKNRDDRVNNNEKEDEGQVIAQLLNADGVEEAELELLEREAVWPTNDLVQLVNNIRLQCPKRDHTKFKTTVAKIAWDQVKFGNYSAEDCSNKWTAILNRQRTFRTLTEILDDAARYVKNEKLVLFNSREKEILATRPKKPLTAFFRFFGEKAKSYKEQNPDLSMTDMSKLLSAEYKQLSEKQKNKYERRYEKDMVAYRTALAAWKEQYPELFHRPRTQNTDSPIRGKTPFVYYTEAQFNKHGQFEGIDPNKIKEELKEKWEKMSDKKKLKYIEMAAKDEDAYKKELEEWRKKHPDRKIEKRFRSLMSKKEQKILQKAQGFPSKPPNSGYALFSSIMMKELPKTDKGVAPTQRMTMISDRWKEMPVHEQEEWNQKAKRKLLKYYEDMEKYVESQPDEKKAEILASIGKLPSRRKLADINKAMEKSFLSIDHGRVEDMKNNQIVSMRAFNLFHAERYTELTLAEPTISQVKAEGKILKEWSKMPISKMARFLRESWEALGKPRLINKGGRPSMTHPDDPDCPPLDTNNRKLIERLKDRVPRPPPKSGYALFSKETYDKCIGTPKERMTELGKKWSLLPKDKKDRFNARARDIWSNYEKEMDNFLKSLDSLESKLYEYYVRDLKTRRLEKKPKPNTNVLNTTAGQIEADDDDDDDDDDDEEEEEPTCSPKGKAPAKLRPPTPDSTDSSDDDSFDSAPSSPVKVKFLPPMTAKGNPSKPTQVASKSKGSPATKTSPPKGTTKITNLESSSEEDSDSSDDSD